MSEDQRGGVELYMDQLTHTLHIYSERLNEGGGGDEARRVLEWSGLAKQARSHMQQPCLQSLVSGEPLVLTPCPQTQAMRSTGRLMRCSLLSAVTLAAELDTFMLVVMRLTSTRHSQRSGIKDI